MDYKVNDGIKAPFVRLVDDNGKMIGDFSLSKALETADLQNLDLVEISPANIPIPICKLMDYDKYRYDLQRKAKNKTTKPVEKEIRLKAVTEEHDLLTKINQINKFLSQKHEVVVVIMFKSRIGLGTSQFNQANAILQRIKADLTGKYSSISAPKSDGKRLTARLTP